MNLTGIHHITAVSARIKENLDFYTGVLGLRLVKKSVNQDDVSAYHLFYADKLGTPGTDLTFFDWPRMGQERRGTDSISGTAFRVGNKEALNFWKGRLAENSIKLQDWTQFAGREILPFEDPEGQRLFLVNDEGAEFEGEIWDLPGIPRDFALRGFYSVILSMPSGSYLGNLFEDVLGFTEVSRELWIDDRTPVTIYSTTKIGGPGTEVWLLEEEGLPPAGLGAGGVHHVAFRVPDSNQQQTWLTKLRSAGLSVSQQIDRFWFESIYFRVSNGILFEIATDGPGFAIDEDPENLGKKLVLPPFLEARRAEIEAGLVPISGG